MIRGEETLIVKIIDPNVKKDREGGYTPIPQAQAISPEQKALREKAQRATPQPTRPEQATAPARKTPYQPNK